MVSRWEISKHRINIYTYQRVAGMMQILHVAGRVASRGELEVLSVCFCLIVSVCEESGKSYTSLILMPLYYLLQSYHPKI